MSLQREQIVAALRTVRDPELSRDIVTLGVVKDVRIDGEGVVVALELTSPTGAAREKIEQDVKAAVIGAGARDVKVQIVAPAAARAPGAGQGPPASAPRSDVLPQVKNVIAVGAGKGGVGKSTLAVNLAVGLHRTGAAVGLMDGDIYGPSVPTLLGIKGQPPVVRGNHIQPHHVHGIHAITIGSLVEQEKPLIWRGPMAHGAFKQLLLDNTDWPELDYLIVDLPPGTGDVPLTLCQLLPVTGAVVVATPQQVALDDAVRAVRMFQQLETPILGLVENMSYFLAPDGSEHDIFGRGGTEKAAQRLGLPYLGALPMFTSLRVNSDSGNPTANFSGDAKLKSSLEAIVEALVAQVKMRHLTQRGPELSIS